MRQLALLLYLILIGGVVQAQERGIQRILQAETRNGERLELYKESHALLIGVSEYTQWPRLDSIPGELDQVEQALKAHDFNVVRLNNPKGRELSNGIDDFIDEFGYERENRILIYFSGHGHSIGNKGFLIPADTPLPEDEGFRSETVPMSRVLSWARDMEAKHALFLFDSCFSGAVFQSRNLPGASDRYIRKATAEPVRQFITAGGADQVVPAKSTFTPALVRAINGEGDLNKDGYITGSELGVHLSQVVPNYVDQNPQYGKIKDYDLAQGDFVFFGQDRRQAPLVVSVTDHLGGNAQAVDLDGPIVTLGQTPQDPIGAEQTFSMLATDESGVESVTLFHRLAGNTEYNATLMQTDASEASRYTAIVRINVTSNSSLEYYVQAKDGVGNITMKGYPFNPLLRTVSPPKANDVAQAKVQAAVAPTASEPAAPTTTPQKNRTILYTVLGVLALGALAGLAGGGGDSSTTDTFTLPLPSLP